MATYEIKIVWNHQLEDIIIGDLPTTTKKGRKGLIGSKDKQYIKCAKGCFFPRNIDDGLLEILEEISRTILDPNYPKIHTVEDVPLDFDLL